MPDSKPASRGIGTHRLGIQHSLGIDRVPGWLVTGGERWSSAIGKECPGDARVAQLPSIIAAAAGGIQEDDMPLTDADVTKLVSGFPLLWGAPTSGSTAELLGPVWVRVWSFTLVLGCLTALVGVWWTWLGWIGRVVRRFKPKPASGLLIEQVGLVAVGFGALI